MTIEVGDWKSSVLLGHAYKKATSPSDDRLGGGLRHHENHRVEIFLAGDEATLKLHLAVNVPLDISWISRFGNRTIMTIRSRRRGKFPTLVIRRG